MYDIQKTLDTIHEVAREQTRARKEYTDFIEAIINGCSTTKEEDGSPMVSRLDLVMWNDGDNDSTVIKFKHFKFNEGDNYKLKEAKDRLRTTINNLYDIDPRKVENLCIHLKDKVLPMFIQGRYNIAELYL